MGFSGSNFPLNQSIDHEHSAEGAAVKDAIGCSIQAASAASHSSIPDEIIHHDIQML